jgi:hypothetical protein
VSTSLTVTVSNIDSALALYDVIKVKRSTTGISGVYSDLTALTPQHATLQPVVGSPYNISGKSLQVVLDDRPQVNITFTGTDPLSASQLVMQLNTALGVAVAAEVGGQLVLTSLTLGTASKILIVGGTSVGDFGWVAGTKAIGQDAHIQLIAGQTLYGFTDQDGDGTDFYKVQFINTSNGVSSDESEPFEGSVSPIIPSINLSTATVDIIDGAGFPLVGQEIDLYEVDEAMSILTYHIPQTRKPIVLVTNNSGHAEVKLVRGSKWRAVFVGTSFVRGFTVPDSTPFDLMAVVADAPDPFEVAEPIFPAAPRRTL